MSSRVWPKARKCRRTMRACAPGDSSGKHSRMLTCTTCRREACRAYSNMPSARAEQRNHRQRQPAHRAHETETDPRRPVARMPEVTQAGAQPYGDGALPGRVLNSLKVHRYCSGMGRRPSSIASFMRAASRTRSPFGKILERRLQDHFVAASARQQAREARHHQRVGQVREPAERGQRRRRHAEERHEHRLALAEILVRQIIEYEPLFQPADHRTQPLRARQQETAEAHAPAVEQPVDHRVALQLDHGERRARAADHGAAEVQPDAVRREQDDVAPAQLVVLLQPADSASCAAVRRSEAQAR